MSKSLNFVARIKRDRRSTDVNVNHPIKLRVWNRASKGAKLYCCNKFNDHLAFENTGDRIESDRIVYQDWNEDAKDIREKGLSYRMISERLKEDGYNVSKSVLKRKLS